MSIEIISTDFDGTLVSDRYPTAYVPELIECIESLRGRGAHWAINTGRTLMHIIEGLREHRFPYSPDYVLTNEREVFRQSPGHRDHEGWEDFGEWNARCSSEHEHAFAMAQEFFNQVEAYAVAQGRLRVVQNGEILEGLVADSEELMDEVVDYLDQTRMDFPLLGYQRNSVYLRFCHINYHKGSALAELSRLLGVDRQRIFAIGDNHNDIPMLDGSAAAMTACPGNSVHEVRAAVRQSGGYVARHHASAGVVEAIGHFVDNPPQA
mgnify:CR=1 FL=1